MVKTLRTKLLIGLVPLLAIMVGAGALGDRHVLPAGRATST